MSGWSEIARAALLDPALAHPAWLTLRTCAAGLAIHFVLGTGLGWALAKPRWPGRTILDMLVTLPLVIPPLALGFFLLVLLGRQSVAGRTLQDAFGLSFVFSDAGVLLAAVVAGLPLAVKPVEAAIGAVSSRLGEASRTLGRGEWDTFIYVILPNIRRAIAGALLLATARSMGEVGITLMLGGNIVGRTNTLSLEIYNSVFNGEYARAVVLSAAVCIVSIAILIVLRRSARSAPD